MDEPAIVSPQTSAAVLAMYYPEARSHALELAAIFDRIERAPGGAETLQDPLVVALFAALGEMKKNGADRSERILQSLSV